MTSPFAASRALSLSTGVALSALLLGCPSVTPVDDSRFVSNLDEHTALYRHGDPMAPSSLRYSIHETSGPGHGGKRLQTILGPTPLEDPGAILRAPGLLLVKSEGSWRVVEGGRVGEPQPWTDPKVVKGRVVARCPREEGRRTAFVVVGGSARPAAWPDYFYQGQGWHRLKPALPGAKYLIVNYTPQGPAPVEFAAERPEEGGPPHSYPDLFLVLIRGEPHAAACAADVLLAAPVTLLAEPKLGDAEKELDETHRGMALERVARRGEEILEACLAAEDPELGAQVLAWWEEHLIATKASHVPITGGLLKLVKAYGAPELAFYQEAAARAGRRPSGVWSPPFTTTDGVRLWYWRRCAEFTRCLRVQPGANPRLGVTYERNQTDTNQNMTLAVLYATLSAPYPLHISRTNPKLNVNPGRGREMHIDLRTVESEQKAIGARLARELYLKLGADRYAAALPELLELSSWTQPEREEVMVQSLERFDSSLSRGSSSPRALALRDAVAASVDRSQAAQRRWRERLAAITKRNAAIKAKKDHLEPEIAKAESRYRSLRTAGKFKEAAKAAARASSLIQEVGEAYTSDPSRLPSHLKTRIAERKLWELDCEWRWCKAQSSLKSKEVESLVTKADSLHWQSYDDGVMAKLRPIRSGLKKKLSDLQAGEAKQRAEQAALVARRRSGGGAGRSGGGGSTYRSQGSSGVSQINRDSARRMQSWNFNQRMRRFDDALKSINRNYINNRY